MQVNLGAGRVDPAGATMNEVVASVKRVTDIIAEITSASQEQTSGIEQINQAITQMDDVTQQNAALVEQAAAAAQAMQDQTGNLSRVVSKFKLVHSTGSATPDLDAARRAPVVMVRQKNAVAPAQKLRVSKAPAMAPRSPPRSSTPRSPGRSSR